MTRGGQAAAVLPRLATRKTVSYKRISVALIPTAAHVAYILLVGRSRERRLAMEWGDNSRSLHWRRLSVDGLTAAAMLAVMLAAMGTTVDVLYLLLISGALVAIGLMLEPEVSAQAAGAGDSVPQPLRSTEIKPARPPPRATDSFDATLVEAARSPS